MPRIRAEEWSIWIQTLNAMEEAVFLLDADSRVCGWNRSAARMLGEAEAKEPAADTAVPISDLGEGEPWRSARSAVHSARFRGRPARRDGFEGITGRHWRIWAETLDGESGMTLLVLSDTTDLHLLHEEIRKEDRLGVLGKTVAGLAHEIRNPLFALTSGMEVLKLSLGDTGRSPVVSETLDLLERELARLSSRMEQFVELDGAPVERSLYSLHSLVEEGWESALRRSGRRDVEIELRIDPRLRCLADRSRVVDAFSRVLDNALSFSPRNETVEVAGIGPGSLPPGPGGSSGPLRRISSLSSRREGYAILCIRDRGPGFRSGDEAKAFEPFYTRSKSGAGLGLALAERVISEHGGAVGAANGSDGGARVYFCLPVVSSDSDRQQPGSPTRDDIRVIESRPDDRKVGNRG